MVITDTGKRRGRPSTGIGGNVGLRLDPGPEAALDTFVAAQPDPKPSRPEAIRTLLKEALATKAPFIKSAICDRAETLEAEVANFPEHDGGRSPEAAMNTMRRTLAKAELTGHARARSSR